METSDDLCMILGVLWSVGPWRGMGMRVRIVDSDVALMGVRRLWGWDIVMSGLLDMTGTSNRHLESVNVEPRLVGPSYEAHEVVFLETSRMVVGVDVAAGSIGVAAQNKKNRKCWNQKLVQWFMA